MTDSIKIRIYSLLCLGVLVVSVSAVLIRWAGEVAAPVIAFYRLAISGGILLLYEFTQSNSLVKNSFSIHWQYLIAGFFLALHFITWIAALQYTTIANAIFLGSTHPFFAIIFSVIILKESPKRQSLPVFVMALAGMYLIVATDFGMDSGHISGDVSAIFSSLFFAIYLIIARIHRHSVRITRYLGIVYTAAAVVCLLFALTRGDMLSGFSDQSWLMLILLALGPSLLGHSLLNWASRNIEVYKVNLAMLLEPVLATLAGMWLFLEYPQFNFYPGAALIIVSMVYLIIMENRRSANRNPVTGDKQQKV
jgi:drug/metabolite transporter (DMT)-like permease